MYRYLFFDADGTLFDFDKAEEVAFELMAKELCIELDEQTFSTYKACNEICWKDFELGKLSMADLKAERFKKFAETVGITLDAESASECYQDHLAEQGIIFNQSEKVLKTLKDKGYKLYLATNGITRVQKGRLRNSGIQHYFGDIFISEELGFQKPDTRFFDAMLQKTQAMDKKEQCLMIGDSLSSDITGAVSSGIDSVWLNKTNNPSSSTIRSTYTITSLEELLEILL